MQKILILIPTSNRSDLAERAIRSSLGQSCEALFKIIVSDNSDDLLESQALIAAVQGITDQRLEYLRPPIPMSMGDHWNWALDQSITRFSPTHVLILTDRMVFRGQALAELSFFARQATDSLITFMHDRINDSVTPVALERAAHSDGFYRVDSARLLQLSSRCVFHQSLPRLLNAVTPVSALQRVKGVFGDYCRTISPDFGFAYRYLATHPELIYLDKAQTIHSGILRSNGASTTRGVLSKDALKFRAAHVLSHVPYPEIFSLGNSILEEYCRVREAPVAAHLPPLQPQRYLKMLYSDSMTLSDTPTRQRFLSQLRARGHGIDLSWLTLRHEFKTKTRWIEKSVKQALRGPKSGASVFPTFGSVVEALSYDEQHPLQPCPDWNHLNKIEPQLVDATASSRPLSMPV